MSGPLVAPRPDGRLEVAADDYANDQYGCQRDTNCILANGHPGDCDDFRVVL